MVGSFGYWGCAAGAAGVGATTQLTYKIVQFDANWVLLGVAVWSVVFIVVSEAFFLWKEQSVLQSIATFVPAMVTMWLLCKTVSLFQLLL